MRWLVLVVGLAIAPAAVASATVDVSRPPKPKVSTLGVTRLAKVFTSCWAYGGGAPQCAAGSVGYPASTLRWRPGAKITIDLRLPARDVSVSAENVYGGAVIARDSVRVRLHRVGRSGQRWTFRLPALAARCTDLIIYARLGDRGDVAADLGLRRR